MGVFLLLWVPGDSLVAVNLCVCSCAGCPSACGCAGLCLTCVCCSVNLCESTDVLESVCWSSFLRASVNRLVMLRVRADVCMCVLCFNSGGQAAANSSLEGAPRGASGRIWRLTALLEHRLAHDQLGRSSWWSPEAACQAPCPLPSSCPSSFSLKVTPGLEGVRTGRQGKARRSAFSSL